jgi:hypothetical protein
VPLLERGHKPDPDEPRYGEGRDWQPADEDDEEDR